MKQLQWILLLTACHFFLTGCDDKDEAIMPEEGIVFSPATPYQEAYPGTIINFKIRVRAHETVNRFGIRFKLPGSADFVALPEYPDLEGEAAAFFSSFRNVEYALPASVDTINTEMRFKFIAGTATGNYEKEYAVKLVSAGKQNLRLYNPTLRNYFSFDAMDLKAKKGVDAADQQFIKDLVAVTAEVKVPLNNTSFQVIKGWQGANGATFKVVTAANYNDSTHKYATIYKAIAAASELTGVSSLLTVNTNKVGVLSTNNPYYIAKIRRDNTDYYVGLMIKKYTPVNLSNISVTTTLDSLNEYMQLEIKQ